MIPILPGEENPLEKTKLRFMPSDCPTNAKEPYVVFRSTPPRSPRLWALFKTQPEASEAPKNPIFYTGFKPI